MCSFLPDSVFGVRMPWAHTTTPVASEPVQPSTTFPEPIKEQSTPLPTEMAAEEASKPTKPISRTPASIELGLQLLRAEQSLRLEKKASALHAETKAQHNTIKQIDDLMSIIAQRAQQNPDGTPNASGNIDCQEPSIVALTNSLRKANVNVPLPNGNLGQADRGHVVNVLVNQRGLLSDEQREKGQELQQCGVEQNSFIQMLMSIADALNRMIVKVAGNIQGRAS